MNMFNPAELPEEAYLTTINRFVGKILVWSLKRRVVAKLNHSPSFFWWGTADTSVKPLSPIGKDVGIMSVES